MRDNEEFIYKLVSNRIIEAYPNVKIINQKLPNNVEQFPAISIQLVNNEVLDEYSTFDQLETVTKETFEFEIANRLEAGMNDIKAILNIIDEEMNKLTYRRLYIGPVEDKEISDARRLAKYEKIIIK